MLRLDPRLPAVAYLADRFSDNEVTLLKVICPRCEKEGKPSLLVTIEKAGDDRVVHGLCWTHRLQLLVSKEPDGPKPGEAGRE